MSYSFLLQTNVRIGVEASLELATYIEQLNVKKIGVVFDSAIKATTPWERLLGVLGRSGDVVVSIENRVSEPDYAYLDECKVPLLEKPVDCVIGVGGGSTLDIAKALSVLIANPGRSIDYRGFNLVKNPGVPAITIPTTAGTGSEVTPYAVFIDKQEKRKLGINTSLYIPKLAVLDPVFTLSCPRWVTVSSGMDAIVHAVESFVAKGATPISKLFATKACSLLLNTLPVVVDDPDNLELRGNMQLGAYYAAVSLMNSGAGPAAAMSYPLGVHFQVPHGMAGAVFLPAVVEHNVQKGCTVYAELYDLLEDAEKGVGTPEKNERFAERLRRMTEALDVPRTLNVYGVTKNEIPRLSREVGAMSAQLGQNPVLFSGVEAAEIMESMVS